MAQAYTAPNWTDGSGQGISASQLQALSNCMEAIVQGTDKAIHSFTLNGTVITVTYVDGSIETFTATEIKGIASVTKTTSGNVDTYTITYTDGTTYSFDVKSGNYTELAAMADVDIDNATDGDALIYSGGKWVNSNVIGDISSVLDAINGEVI